MVKKRTEDIRILYLTMLIFKISMEVGFWFILCQDKVMYTADFNIYKYINGMIWCTIIFLSINHEIKRVSTFFLYFKYIFEIIPITIIFALSNESYIYYNVVCLAFLICVLIVSKLNIKCFKINTKYSSYIIEKTMIVTVIVLLIYTFLKNGLPTITALNIYDVYDLRSSGQFKISKYMGYILSWTVCVILPFFTAKALSSQQYFKAALASVLIFLLYLYSGHKTYLFAVPLVIVCTIWSRRRNFVKEFFNLFCLGATMVTLLAFKSSIFSSIFSLFGRRVMIVSANNKFKYYDFFSSNSKIGFEGFLPRWGLNTSVKYENIGNIIGEKYFDKPGMNVNTGFLAEGYMRFGIIGIFLSLIIFAIILLAIDKMQERIGYEFAIGTCIYMVFRLNDAHLIDSLFFGTWMIMLLIILIYQNFNVIGILDKIPEESLTQKRTNNI